MEVNKGEDEQKGVKNIEYVNRNGKSSNSKDGW